MYFDDFEVMLTEGKVVQSNNYYPFGLQQNTSWTRAAQTPNAHKFNAATEYNDFTDTYDTPFRQYDPATGRFNGVDALAHMTPTLTPYRFGFNNPVSFNDPTGLFEKPYELTMMDKHGGSILTGADNVFGMSWLSGRMGRTSIGSGAYHTTKGYRGSGSFRYSSVSAMATDAWNATPENGWSVTTFDNGSKTGFASGTMADLGGSGHGAIRVYNKYAGKAVKGNKYKGAYVYDFEALMFLANQGGTLELGDQNGGNGWSVMADREPVQNTSQKHVCYGQGHKLGVAGNLSFFDTGYSVEIGLVWDDHGDLAIYVTHGPSVGFDGSFGIVSGYMQNVTFGEAFTINQYKGNGQSENGALLFFDMGTGGDNFEPDNWLKGYGSTYNEYEGGGSVGSPLGYTRQFTNTFFIWSTL